MPNTSLSAFCKEHSLSKGSVHKFLKAEGFDTTEGLTPEAIKAVTAYFLDTPPAAPAAGAMTIDVGNHCTALDVPSYDGLTVDLAQFRDSNALVIEDPLAVADQFLQTADLILAGFDGDIAARERRLEATKQAQAKIAAKAQELALEQRLYRLQTSQIDAAQTDETKSLADALGTLKALGKPTEPDTAAAG